MRVNLYPADVATTITILLGFISISLNNTYGSDIAATLILLSVLSDGLDGYLARKFNSADDGEAYDTMSDIVAFTVAPSYVIFTYMNELNPSISVVPFILSVVYLMSSIIHLRKYLRNKKTIGCQTTVVAIPICTAIVISNPILVTLCVLLSSGLTLIQIEYPQDIPVKTKLLGGLLVSISILPVYISLTMIPTLITTGVVVLYIILAPYIEMFSQFS